MKDKMKCVYCGKAEATEIIMNPNFDDIEPSWNVCVVCKEVIKWQQQLSFGSVMADRPFAKDMGERLIKEANENLDRIAKETGEANMTAMIYKKKDGSYDSISIEYTGNK